MHKKSDYRVEQWGDDIIVLENIHKYAWVSFSNSSIKQCFQAPKMPDLSRRNADTILFMYKLNMYLF